MCEDCGCTLGVEGDRHRHDHRHGDHDHHHHHHEHGEREVAVQVLAKLLSANDRQATDNRAHFDAGGILAVNLMSSPGSGKTALLERTIDGLRETYRIAVIEGDLATENDAARIRAHGVPAVQITTGSACHLDAHMIHDALHALDLGGLDIVFIENVGNLVCPASFDLGQHHNVALLSVTEGDDKPAKYPVMFRAADLVLLTKSDLGRFIEEFDPTRAMAHIRELANPAPVISLSAKSGDNIEAWLAWVDDAAIHRRASAPMVRRA